MPHTRVLMTTETAARPRHTPRRGSRAPARRRRYPPPAPSAPGDRPPFARHPGGRRRGARALGPRAGPRPVVLVSDGPDRGRPSPARLLLRADMDALPLQEDTGLEFASETGARCTPAATTRTSRCCWARRGCSSSGATSCRGASCSCSSPARRASAAPGSCSTRACWTAEGARGPSTRRSRSTSGPATRPATIAFGPARSPRRTARITVEVAAVTRRHRTSPLDPIPVAADSSSRSRPRSPAASTFRPGRRHDRQGQRRDDEQHHPRVRRAGRARSARSRRGRGRREGSWSQRVVRRRGATERPSSSTSCRATRSPPTTTLRRVVRDVAARSRRRGRGRRPHGADHGRRGLLVRPPEGARGDGVPRRACRTELDPATAPQNHSNLVVFDEEAMPVGVALYAAVALRHLGGA